MTRIAAALVLLGALACSASPDASDSPDAADALADLASVENGRLVEELRIGGLDGPIESTFGSITAIRPISGGGFCIIDGHRTSSK